ncbi:SulP family inorganic anion transporter [Castellaniella hirudinis]|uniref:SulP family inorganic anion transporter n=1 Tax=Castellaniella hirudinis TaxID=1144617 RepID=UPI0039C08828
MGTAANSSEFLDLYTPKLWTILKQGYGLAGLRADAVAGLTVAIVALPLSMAIAIASGVTPDRGLYASIFGGFIVSALGGSRFQIGGPAGAFIVLVAAAVAQHGVEGLLLATLISGLMLIAMGLLRLGVFIKYIPYPVTVGFTAGIAVIIFASQIKDLLGLRLDHEPGPLWPKLQAIGGALPTFGVMAVVVAAVTVGVILLVRRLRPQWPSFLIAVAVATVLASGLQWPVDTIGSRFGGIPQTLPMPHWPAITWDKVVAVLPTALAFTLLGCIESLLSAVVADSMTGRRHRSNCELVAQGVANVVTPLFGGICVTGNIARTATNVRSGAHGPVAGMLHAVFLLLFVLVAAPVASYIPLAALAGVLVIVAWNMVEKHAFMLLLRASWGDAIVLMVTFLLVIFRDLSEGILVGFACSTLLFLHRMSQAVSVEHHSPRVEDDVPDAVGEPSEDLDSRSPAANDPEIAVIRVTGAFFFGATAAVESVLDRIADQPKAYIMDLSAVSLLDATAVASIEGFAHKAKRRKARVYITAGTPAVRRTLVSHGIRGVRFCDDIHTATALARRKLRQAAPA